MVSSKQLRITFPGFSLGLGALGHVPRAYAITTNAITRFGRLMNGLKEVADRTGIAAGYRIIKIIKHNDVNIAITQNGTNSIVYRVESGVWAAKETVNSALCTDVVSFHDGTNSILAVAYGTTAFRYSTDDGGTWTASTLGASNANFFIAQQSGFTAKRIVWVYNPNNIYWATSLVNGTTVNTGSTVGDGSAQTYFTMLDEDDTGVLLIGMRHALWSLDSAGNVFRLTRDFNDSPATAGGQGDRRNFESYGVLDNVFYFIVEGHELISYYHGQVQEKLAPKYAGLHIPRLDLPINAICVAGEYVIVALGSANTGTNRSMVPAPGGTTLLQNTFVTVSELYVGRPGIVDGQEVMQWWGSELTCTDLLRYIWFDEDDSYLYLASGDSELINAQARRCYFFTTDPLYTLVSSNIQLNTAAATLETGIIGADDPFEQYVPEIIKCITTGLASTVPSLQISYRFVPEHDTTTAYVALDTYTSNQRALNGTHFPRTRSFQLGRLQFILTGDAASTPDVFGVLQSAELILSSFVERKLPAGVV